MSVTSTLRRGALAISIAAVGVIGMGGTALAGDVSSGGGSVTYTGDATAETLRVTQSAATVVTFDLTGAPVTTSDPACTASNSNGADVDNEVTCTVAGLHDITVDLLAGNDSFVATAATQVEARGGVGDDRLDLTAATFDGGSLSPNMQFCCSTNTISGEEGNDTLLAGPNTTLIGGGDGNDSLTGGAGDDLINGGIGQDTLIGGGGDDYLSGGDVFGGSPSFTSTSDGADSIDGGVGTDTVSYANRTTSVKVDLNVASGQGEANENDSVASIENIDGGNGGDTLTGNAASNTIQGFDGADLIAGGRGFDDLRGGRDADSVQVAGDVTADLVDCGSGFSGRNVPGATMGTDADVTKLDYLDLLATGSDCETVIRKAPPSRAPQLGTNGNDRIVGDSSRDLLLGLDGNDVLLGLANSDELQGGFGNDRLVGGSGTDELGGGPGADGVSGGDGNDKIDGGAGNDYLVGGAGSDTISGDSGSDRINGGAGRDYLLARDGSKDTLVCTATRVASQQDIVYVDEKDVVLNARYCGKIART